MPVIDSLLTPFDDPDLLRLSKGPFSLEAPFIVFEELTPAPPANPVVTAQLLITEALKHLAHKQYEPAEQRLSEVLRLMPDHRLARTWLLVAQARHLMDEGRQVAARERYQRVIEIDPTHREARRAVGVEQRGFLARWLGRLTG